MISRMKHATLFALYQATVVAGIALLPVALVLGQFGVTLPFHRVVAALHEATEDAQH